MAAPTFTSLLDFSVPSTWVSSEHSLGWGSESGVQDSLRTSWRPPPTLSRQLLNPRAARKGCPELQDRLSWGEKAPHSLNDSLTQWRIKCSPNVYLSLHVCVFAAAFGEQASTSSGSGLHRVGRSPGLQNCPWFLPARPYPSPAALRSLKTFLP